jgi:hypothetical protein
MQRGRGPIVESLAQENDMPASTDHPLVETALQLSMELPDRSALYVLDLAMRPHRGSHPELADALQAPAPFIELVRRALDPQWDPRQLMLMSVGRTNVAEQALRFDAASVRHAALLESFAQRYALWQPVVEAIAAPPADPPRRCRPGAALSRSSVLNAREAMAMMRAPDEY